MPGPRAGEGPGQKIARRQLKEHDSRAAEDAEAQDAKDGKARHHLADGGQTDRRQRDGKLSVKKLFQGCHDRVDLAREEKGTAQAPRTPRERRETKGTDPEEGHLLLLWLSFF